MTLTLLQCSDIHFGIWAIPEQYEALERLIEAERADVVAVAGDLSQRARIGEFQRARELLRRAERVSRTIVVPGNHDVAWWFAPLGFGDRSRLFRAYKQFVSDDLEPVLRIPGATFVGLNSSHGIIFDTLTTNARDLSILGHLESSQIEKARAEFAKAPADDLKVVVMHHNLVKGQLSQRFGLKRCDRILDAFGQMGVDLVLCGHDHQEAAHEVQCGGRTVVVSTSSATSAHMVRGGRPPALQRIVIEDTHLSVTPLIWSGTDFLPGAPVRFGRPAM